MMASRLTWANHHIGASVLYALLLLCTVALFFASLCFCRRRSDPARHAVTWMKLSLLFACSHYFIVVLFSVMSVLYYRGIFYGGYLVSVPSGLGVTLGIIHKATVVVVLSSLGRGILTARTGERPKRGLLVAVATYATAAIVTILTIAAFGLWISYIVRSYEGSGWMIDTLLNINRLNAVAEILVFVGSVFSLVAAVVIFTKIRKQYPTLKTASLVYDVSSFTFFVSTLYGIVYIGVWIPLSLAQAEPKREGPHVIILQFFFNSLPAFASLALIFNLARTKDKGLWTVGRVPPGFQPQQKPYQGQPMPGQPQAQFGQYPQQGGYFPQGAAPQWHYYGPQQPGQPPMQGMPQQQFVQGQPPMQGMPQQQFVQGQPMQGMPQQQFVQGQPPTQEASQQQFAAQSPIQSTPSPVGNPTPPQPAP